MEGYSAETAMVKEEIRTAIHHLKRWMKPKRVKTPLLHFPSKSRIESRPLGVTLILAPWNYPFQLCLIPLVAAIAAGNCAVVKPSRMSPTTGKVIEKIIAETFAPEYVACVDLTADSYDDILAEKYDSIFFTGSESVGKKVMAEAAKQLTPVTLELGGKSPCIVESSADIPVTARRIVWGKFLNAGQTCVAPDYILVDRKIAPALIEALQQTITAMFGKNPVTNPDFPHIISDRHFQRLISLLPGSGDKEKIITGGENDPRTRKIAPTLIANTDFDSPVMQEEIFGPLLPIIEYDDLDETVRFLQRRPSPLALYLFTRNKQIEKDVLPALRFGGGCVNDTIVHLANPALPFGGVGASGMGQYHGQHGFETFSHQQSILTKGLWLDLPFRYAPYTEKIFRLMRLLMR